MSNITQEHEDKHGIISNGIAKIPVTITSVPPGRYFIAQIDGSHEKSTFLSEEWAFTPSPEPLPTRIGFYESAVYPMGDVRYHYPYYFDGSRWYVARRDGFAHLSDSYMEELMPLTLLGSKA